MANFSIKSNLRRSFLYLIVMPILFSCVMFGQENQKNYNSLDSNKFRAHKNYIYLSPLAFGGDMWTQIDNVYWIYLGYDRLIKNKMLFGINLGYLVYSGSNQPNILTIPYLFSEGYNINVEGKYLMSKNFYVSVNVFYQLTKTYSVEGVNEGTPQYYKNEYFTNRYEYCITPKIGWIWQMGKHFYEDFGIGVGLKYISSNSPNVIIPLPVVYHELFSGKPFAYGSVSSLKLLIQYKIGFCF
jgi:hypothetical protein